MTGFSKKIYSKFTSVFNENDTNSASTSGPILVCKIEGMCHLLNPHLRFNQESPVYPVWKLKIPL